MQLVSWLREKTIRYLMEEKHSKKSFFCDFTRAKHELRIGDVILIESPQYENHQWEVYPFLFSCDNREVKLNWENSDSKWISVNELNDFTTVPSLDKVLTRLF